MMPPSNQSQYLDPLSIYNGFVYEWDLNSDQIYWEPPARLLLNKVDTYKTGDFYGARLEMNDFLERIVILHRQAACHGNFVHTYPLEIPKSPPCLVREKGRLILTQEGTPVKIIGSIKKIKDQPINNDCHYIDRYDKLTSLPNRVTLSQTLHAFLQQQVDFGDNVILVIIMIDRLPLIGLQKGLSTAQRILKHVGTILRSSVRHSDIVARLSGNQFALILKNCNPQGVVNFSKRALFNLQEKSSAFYNPRAEVPLQISVGSLALNAKDDLTVNLIFEQARNTLLDMNAVRMMKSEFKLDIQSLQTTGLGRRSHDAFTNNDNLPPER